MWLVALYSVLVATAVFAVVSLLILGGGFRHGLRAALLLFVPTWLAANIVFAYAIHRTAYSIESRDPFCISCHLHENEFTRFHDEQSSVAPDLANYHARHGKEFTCITCHVGEGVAGRARVLFYAGLDVVNYTGGNFQQELDGMKHPLMDTTCTKCHVLGKIGGFHASEKHAGYTSACLGCHSAHVRGDEAFGFIAYHRWPPAMAEPCLPCHPALLG
jgi:nitrate/TMAO reductase-like tetraheme cytochrome c subunit